MSTASLAVLLGGLDLVCACSLLRLRLGDAAVAVGVAAEARGRDAAAARVDRHLVERGDELEARRSRRESGSRSLAAGAGGRRGSRSASGSRPSSSRPTRVTPSMSRSAATRRATASWLRPQPDIFSVGAVIVVAAAAGSPPPDPAPSGPRRRSRFVSADVAPG